MKYKSLSVEVGTDVHRDVSYALEVTATCVRVHMTYKCAAMEPLELWPPLLLNNTERAEDLVRLWSGWLYD